MFSVSQSLNTKTGEPIIITLLLVEGVTGHPYKIHVHLMPNSSQLSQVTLSQLCGRYLCRVFTSFANLHVLV